MSQRVRSKGIQVEGRRHRWRPDCQWLPRWCVLRLDAEGKIRGVTWREMPAACRSDETTKAMNWWLWKRGLLYPAEMRVGHFQRAKRDALEAMTAAELAEQEATGNNQRTVN